ncbi:guanine deaminase [Gigaspora margarita]|uniref:Guanine deaminase n=1 Tax=Gigaspora margarita TaxID=4874 RepID=A0A8H4AZ33_GIGMA|nr:guanine deaminase [Gigaspora margarita]
MSVRISQIFYGTLIHSLSLTELEFIHNALLGVNNQGKIVFLERNVSNEQTLRDIIKKWETTEDKVVRLTNRQFLLPGFVDTHTHASQYPNAGIGMDLPLLDWLKKYTFPLEQSYSSLNFAEKIYPIVVNHLLSCGTTTAVYFATIHLEASEFLAKIVQLKGQRGFIGKVNMDRKDPEISETYGETTESSVKNTEKFVEYVLNLKHESTDKSCLVTPIITPRFAISCSSELLNSLGEIAKKYNIPIQSHLSENTEEIATVSKLFPHLENYTSVYDHHNLLNHRTIMAHGVHLSPQERKLLKERNVGISHCPNSNFTLCSGVCNVRQLLDEGIKVGLGTDISGGFSKSILDSIRNASIASRTIYMSSKTSDKDFPPLTLSELTYLATMGGAQLVNLENVIGNFTVGKEFDALLIDPEAEGAPIHIVDELDTIHRIFEKFMFLGDERNIKSVFVKGCKVSGTDITNLEANKYDEKLLAKFYINYN